jgi:uncharacterized protein
MALFTNFTAPGVRVQEREEGFRVLEISDFNAVYMFGTASAGEFATATLCTTKNNFVNQFPGSGSLNYVNAMFDQNSALELYFCRVGVATVYLFTLLNAIPANIAFTILGKTFTYTIVAPATIPEIVEDLIAIINSDVDISSQVEAQAGSTTDTFRIVSRDFTLDFTPSGLSGNITAVEQTGVTPTALDYTVAIENTFQTFGKYRAGFALAPEAFMSFGSSSDRQKVGLALEDLVTNFDWCALVDAGSTLTKVSELQTERNLYGSPKGHSWFLGNSAFNLSDQRIPMSCYVASIGTSLIALRGIQKSIAGIDYPLQNVTRVSTEFDDTQQGVLSGSQVNILRRFDGVGVVIWEILTMSTNTNYAQQQGRVVMNVINNTLRGIPGVYSSVFEPIDDEGIFMLTLKSTISSVLRRLWVSGALFGKTENDAYAVICDFENNSLENLQLGQVYAEVYASTTPNARKILIDVVKVPIGQIQSAIVSGEELDA